MKRFTGSLCVGEEREWGCLARRKKEKLLKSGLF